MSDLEKQKKALEAILSLQVEDYIAASDLEIELSEMLGQEDMEKVPENTQNKKSLMAAITSRGLEIDSILAELNYRSGEYPTAKAEQIRQDAKRLLNELSVLQKSNMQMLESVKDKMLSGIQHSTTAKKAARGYRRTSTGYRTNIDTES